MQFYNNNNIIIIIQAAYYACMISRYTYRFYDPWGNVIG